ncbi:activating transcription factor 7-interacting protein 2 isoform X3 [Moschus berezovskii]|uniref:activating transcription factor 7-interacting protein 2 isoform X3 n=1 Tax=Moschus berezovskii TaxID=68408 RepID=UPI002444FC7E|nr:activating transcription factor 7-interacting protein 2 isoform X3 [Moschus berezovskii]
MASPDRSKRKILKAKKTMPVSCRKQVEILNNSRNVEALKTAAIENNVSSGNQNSSTDIISCKCRHSENDASSLNSIKNSVCEPKSKEFSQNLLKPLEIIDLETRLEYTEEQVVYPYEKPSKTVEFPRKLFIHEAKDSQNTSENHFECQASVTRSFFEHEEDCNLKSICHLSSVLSGIVQIPKSTKTNTLDDKRIDKIVSYLEANSSAELYDKKQSDILIFSSDDPFVPADKIPKLVNSVISSNCADDILKSEESYRTCLSSILSCENVDARWLSSLDTDSNNSHNQKKRMFSENKENVKRVKTSKQINENISVALEKQTALLEQVRHLIREEICSINYKLFDNKLRELTERIGKTQCKNKHEAIADELLAKIAKLQRRVKAVLLSQRHCVEPNVESNNTACKVANSETMNLAKNPESVNSPQERKTVKSETSNPSEKASKKINWSREHNEAVSESIKVFSSESTLHMRWPKCWSFSFSISPSNEHPGLISFRMDWLDLLAVQGTLKSLLQHHSSKASILRRSAFFTVQLSHPYMTIGKTIALIRRTLVGKVMSLLFNMLSSLVITFLPRSKRLLIS